MSFDRDPSTPPRHRRGCRIVGPAILLAAAALFASASGAATEEGADIALVDLGMVRAAVGSTHTFAYEIDNVVRELEKQLWMVRAQRPSRHSRMR
jgi:hypothetical protein